LFDTLEFVESFAKVMDIVIVMSWIVIQVVQNLYPSFWFSGGLMFELTSSKSCCSSLIPSGTANRISDSHDPIETPKPCPIGSSVCEWFNSAAESV
jgi:hypothetical protein